MSVLTEGLVLFHGSYAAVDKVDLSKCAPGKDFGRGFYLTSSYTQAVDFIPLSIRKRHAETGESCSEGFVSIFKVGPVEGLSILSFEDANADWLHFVAANRREGLFPELLAETSQYDIVVGKIANDRTARTLQLYVTGAYGEPGSPEADSIAIATLLPNRLEDQFCFRTPAALERLLFEGSERYALS